MSCQRDSCDGAAPARRDRTREWIMSLPWVVERPHVVDAPGQTLAIDCPPLGIRQVWLVSGLAGGYAIVAPFELADELRLAGLASQIAPMPLDYKLVRVAAGTDADELARVVLASYNAIFRAAED